MGPNPNGPLSKLLELLDTQVEGSVQWVLLEISWVLLASAKMGAEFEVKPWEIGTEWAPRHPSLDPHSFIRPGPESL